MKIISFCLYGKNEIYNRGAIINSKLAKKHYPDFQVWIYISSKDDINDKAYVKLSEMENVKLIDMNDTDKSFGIMLWRYIPAFNVPDLEIFITRDLDSLIDNKTDLYCTKDWINSDIPFHTIKDHHRHFKYPIMGGIWSVKGTFLHEYKDVFNKLLENCKWTNTTFKNDIMSYKALRKCSSTAKRGINVDQIFLRQYLYPKIKGSVLVHYRNLAYEVAKAKDRVLDCKETRFIPEDIKDTLVGDREYVQILYYDLSSLAP